MTDCYRIRHIFRITISSKINLQVNLLHNFPYSCRLYNFFLSKSNSNLHVQVWFRSLFMTLRYFFSFTLNITISRNGVIWLGTHNFWWSKFLIYTNCPVWNYWLSGWDTFSLSSVLWFLFIVAGYSRTKVVLVCRPNIVSAGVLPVMELVCYRINIAFLITANQ